MKTILVVAGLGALALAFLPAFRPAIIALSMAFVAVACFGALGLKLIRRLTGKSTAGAARTLRSFDMSTLESVEVKPRAPLSAPTGEGNFQAALQTKLQTAPRSVIVPEAIRPPGDGGPAV